MNKSETKYRIVTNGLNYRIQWLSITIFRKPKWIWIYRIHPEGSHIAEFDTKEEAENGLRRTKECAEAKERGYQPI